MHNGISTEEAERFRNRWGALREIELRELRAMTIDDKFRCVSQLNIFAREMGWPDDRATDEERVRTIWRRIRGAFVDGRR